VAINYQAGCFSRRFDGLFLFLFANRGEHFKVKLKSKNLKVKDPKISEFSIVI
jgi:hypothetical protein